jgi:hypothetical protein
MKIYRMKKNTLYILIVILIQFSIALGFFLSFYTDFLTDNMSFFAPDAIHLRERAIEFATSDFSIIEFINKYGLNWSSLSVLGSIAYFNGSFNDSFIFILNLLLLSLSYFLLIKLINQERYKINYLFLIIFTIYAYIPYSLIQLNKELIGFSFIIFLLYAYHKNKKIMMLLIAFSFGFVRIQYFGVAIELFILLLFQYSKSLKFLIILNLLVINFITVLFVPPIMELWHNNVGGNQNSYALMKGIEDTAHILIIGVFSLMERILISLFTGLYSPIKVFLININLASFIYNITIFLLSIMSILTGYKYFKTRKYKLNRKSLYYSTSIILIVFLSFNSLAPYLQPRYYLPIITLLFILNMPTYNLKRKKS